jgi:hypothetical protein
MRPRLDALYVGWLLLHLLLVALVCAHEAFWLLGRQLTMAPQSSSRLWKRLEEVSATLIASNASSHTISRNFVGTYSNLAGIEAGYGYFAPNVPEIHALVFELRYPDNHLEYFAPTVATHEGELRLTSLIEQIARTDFDSWRNELIRRLARSTWQQHPSAISLRGFFGSITPPTLAAYRSGKRERVFTCQYVYDFGRRLEKEKAGPP